MKVTGAMWVASVSALAMTVALGATTASAIEPDVKCQSGKLKEASKYGACRLKAQSKAVAKGTDPDFAKCELKFAGGWSKVEGKAGPGVCPSEGDEGDVDGRITQHANDLGTLLSGGTVPGCDLGFITPVSIDVEASGDLVVLDNGLDGVLRVDSVSGARTLLSYDFAGSGPFFSDPQGLAVESAGTIVVTDAARDAVLRVDPVTGDRTILSDDDTPDGTNGLGSPNAIAVEAGGNLVVADSGADAVIRIDPITGARTIVSEDGVVGTGTGFSSPRGIAVEPSGSLIVTDTSLDAVFRVDETTGDRTILSDDLNGTGPFLSTPNEVVVDNFGNIFLVDAGLDAVVAIDPVTGNRTIVSDDDVPASEGGQKFDTPEGIAVESGGDMVVADVLVEAVLRVDSVSGARTVLSF